MTVRYIATSHTHLSALMTDRALKNSGVPSGMAPVPRALSSSCGTCVRFECDTDCRSLMDGDVEALYREDAADAYTLLVRYE